MIVAAVLVTLTSAVTGLLGTTLLRSYLFDRVDTQLRSFGTVPRPGRLPARMPGGK